MTKVIQKNIRCIKCGEVSPQLLVYSVNFNLGQEDDNNNLLTHKQVCPQCGYTAKSISISDELISYDEKVKIARHIYDNLDLKDCELSSSRDEDIMADYFSVPNTRGPGGIIIGDDGSYLFCQSAYSYEYHKEKYKNGERHN